MIRATLDAGAIDVAASLAAYNMLPRDPTVLLGPGSFDRATLTPEGRGRITVTWTVGRPEVVVRTEGDGEEWLQRQAPAMIGLHDDVSGFDPAEAPLRNLWRLHRGSRVTASGTLWHDLAWFIVQQRVTRQEAADSWARMVRALGTPAPGPDDLTTPPTPAVVGSMTYERLHPFGLERRRAENLIAAARCAHRLMGADVDSERSATALSAVRGIGPWTLSCLRTFTWGSADTVILGDSGIPSMVTWLLAGERRGTDERMLDTAVRGLPQSGSEPPLREGHSGDIEDDQQLGQVHCRTGTSRSRHVRLLRSTHYGRDPVSA